MANPEHRDESASAGEPVQPWHALTAESCLARLGARREGLSAAEAERRLVAFGANRLPELPGRPAWRRLLDQFRSLLIYVLLAAAVVTAVIGRWLDFAVILGVVVINAVIGFLQEGRAEHALAAIRKLLALSATVLRDGRPRKIPAEALVPGDIVLLEPGDRLSADLRLIETRALRTQEAALTGESAPVEKQAAPVEEGTMLAERASMAYAGTLVTHGHGIGVVVATGAQTEAGRIGRLLAEIEPTTTPLAEQLARFGRVITYVVLALAVAVFAAGVFWRDYDHAEMLLVAVGLGVAAVPEALPAIVTIALAIGVQRMARRRAIVRRLPAVETLGAVSVICTDKTGTLTRNEMMVETVVAATGPVEIGGVGYGLEGGFMVDGARLDTQALPAELGELLRAALLCNDAYLDLHGDKPRLEGDPTELALLVLGHKAGRRRADEERALPRLDFLPFLSERRFMATLHQTADGGRRLYVKGAPERVLDLCAFPPGAPDRVWWEEWVDRLARRGHRVLALASREDGELEILERRDRGEVGLGMLGLVGMTDPPRPEAIAAIAQCRAAGIRVKMITGDHAETARAIAERLGFTETARVATGADLDRVPAVELPQLAREVDVFARTGPEHKLRLVEALQAARAVVAMTGDGVNDSPALKRADVGVAMGLGGTEAAKEAAQLVLTDDNFATIAAAVEEGRTIYENLKKTLAYLLPTNGGEAAAIVAAVLWGVTLPITPLQILWINLVTEVTLTLAIAFEPAEPAIMRRPPRPRGEGLLSRRLIWRIAVVTVLMLVGCFGLFLWEIERGGDVALARTAAVNGLVAIEIVYLFNSRSIDGSMLGPQAFKGNRVALWAAAAILVLQLAFTYAPPLQMLFATAALPAASWGPVLAAAAATFLMVEGEKAVARAWARRRG
jgi:magnesium-transporting ATPase (P-type)